jgi:hypothetical protein
MHIVRGLCEEGRLQRLESEDNRMTLLLKEGNA